MEQYSTSFVLVFSGEIIPLERERIKFWCVGIGRSDLLGIVINFLCTVSSLRLLLWCFSLVMMSLFLSFYSLKTYTARFFVQANFKLCYLPLWKINRTYPFWSLTASQRHIFFLMFFGYICRFSRFRTIGRNFGTPP